MNIVIFSRSTIDHFISGGMETQLLNLSEGLASKGHQVDIITTSYPNINGVEMTNVDITRNGVRYFFIGGTTPGLRPASIIEKILIKLRIYKRSKFPEGPIDYFHQSLMIYNEQNLTRKYNLALSQSTMAYGVYEHIQIPIISIIHGTITGEMHNRKMANKTIKNKLRYYFLDLPGWIYELRTVNKDFFTKVSKIISVSDALVQEIHSEQKISFDRIKVIYNGVDHDKFSPKTAEKSTKFTVLNIGRMDREKGIDLIIKAVGELTRKGLDITLKLIGNGVHINEFKVIASEEKILDRVEFIGEVINDNIPQHYASSHLFVLPSRRNEGHPMVLSEALCSGLPIIGTNKGGIKNTIVEGTNGYLIEDENIGQLASYIEKLYYDNKLLNLLSENARKIGVEKYSKKAMIEGYDLVIKEYD